MVHQNKLTSPDCTGRLRQRAFEGPGLAATPPGNCARLGALRARCVAFHSESSSGFLLTVSNRELGVIDLRRHRANSSSISRNHERSGSTASFHRPLLPAFLPEDATAKGGRTKDGSHPEETDADLLSSESSPLIEMSEFGNSQREAW